ncbi:MAG: serine/threonine-protein kinase, partial [Chloroflexota bacterium]
MSELGHGGMSDSYRARDRESGENVVIKVPLSNRLDDAAGRYQREAEIGRRLHHPNVQHVIGTGRLPDGTPYLALEYVEGEALRVYLTAHAPLDPWRALQLAQQVGAALAACHEQGIVHRDVKPENLLITASGQLKLLDFGIALPKGEHRMGWNRLGGTAGTPDYMAPEQARGQPGDARSDVYALGALLYEMLSGRPPFAGDNALAVMHQRNDREAQRVTEHAPGTPAPLDAIVARALRRDPARRYPSLA